MNENNSFNFFQTKVIDVCVNSMHALSGSIFCKILIKETFLL